MDIDLATKFDETHDYIEKAYVAETENGHDAMDSLDAESPHRAVAKEH